MVAIVVLLVGVLGVVVMLDGANAVTSRTKAREGATNLSRSVLELARGAYRELTANGSVAELRAVPASQMPAPRPATRSASRHRLPRDADGVLAG